MCKDDMANGPGRSGNILSEDLAQEAARTGRIPKGARLRYAVSILFVVISDSVADVMLKYGLQHVQVSPIHSFSDLPRAALSVVKNGWLDLAVILMVLQFVAMIYALRFGPLSITIPIRGGSVYVGTTLLAQYFLGEQVTLVRWAAILLILTGVVIVGITGEKE